MISLEDLHALCPTAKIALLQTFVDPVNAAMAEFGINETPEREAMFLATVAHESGGFGRLEENLNYSAQGLVQTWPKRFAPGEAASHARHPELIANRVYADRMGNGGESSGDGWRYRGAGLIQLTGKLNQTAAAKHFDIPLEQIGEWLRTPEGACRSAAWFWQDAGCNELADAGNFLGITRRVNGGTIGLPDRQAYLLRAQQVIA